MRRGVISNFVLAGAAFLALAAPAGAQSIRDLPGFRERSIPRNDDGSAPLDNLGFTINFFGRQRSTVYVTTKGT